MLGQLLAVREQLGGKFLVPQGISGTPTGAGRRSYGGGSVLDADQHLGRGAHDRDAGQPEKVHVRRRVERAQHPVDLERRHVGLPGEDARRHQLAGVAGRDARGRFPYHVGKVGVRDVGADVDRVVAGRGDVDRAQRRPGRGEPLDQGIDPRRSIGVLLPQVAAVDHHVDHDPDHVPELVEGQHRPRHDQRRVDATAGCRHRARRSRRSPQPLRTKGIRAWRGRETSRAASATTRPGSHRPAVRAARRRPSAPHRPPPSARRAGRARRTRTYPSAPRSRRSRAAPTPPRHRACRRRRPECRCRRTPHATPARRCTRMPARRSPRTTAARVTSGAKCWPPRTPRRCGPGAARSRRRRS